MFNILKKFTHKENNVKLHNPSKKSKPYVTPDDLSRKTKKIFEPIQKLEIPNNDKPNILIMDDDYSSTEYLKRDFIELSDISRKLKNNKSLLKIYEKRIINDATPDQLKLLKKININDYNIIIARGNMAAFSVIDAIKKGTLKNVKIAILDIIMGGFKIENDYNTIYDGIDVAKELWSHYKDIQIMFYTGCTIGKYSEESNKFRKFFPDRSDILDYTLFKDLNLNLKKFKILDMFDVA